MKTSPAHMAAIEFRRGSTLDDPDCLTDGETERPEPGPHDLRVAVHAVSVNPLDSKVRSGRVVVPDGVRSLGWDAAPPVTHITALSHTAEHLHELAELIAPQGRLAIIDEHDALDAAPFKAKSVSLDWGMVCTAHRTTWHKPRGRPDDERRCP